MDDFMNPSEYCEELIIIPTRCDFEKLLEAKGLLGKGVEVGVCEGEYSLYLLSTWKGDRLYSVDPWKAFGEEYTDINNAHQDLHDIRYQQTKEKLSVFGKKSIIVRKTSLEASILFGNETVDFVYLDAQHHYDAVRADILAWYPKIRSGGILCGHDYIDGVYIGGIFGVRLAVQEFAKRENLQIYVSGETGDEVPSWYLLKP